MRGKADEQPTAENAGIVSHDEVSGKISRRRPPNKPALHVRNRHVSIAVMFSRVWACARDDLYEVARAAFLYDAYVVAFRIPNVLRDLFAEGALSVAFVRFLLTIRSTKAKEAWRLRPYSQSTCRRIERYLYCRHFFRGSSLISLRTVSRRKSRSRDYSSPDNVPVHPAIALAASRWACSIPRAFSAFRHGIDGLNIVSMVLASALPIG
jgi:hypothetical protein